MPLSPSCFRLRRSMAFSTMEAYEFVCQKDRLGNVIDSPRHNMKKAATIFLSNTTQKREFSLPTARRASKVLGPISRHSITQVLSMVCAASRASHPGLAEGVLRVLCNGVCSSKRFHVENDDQSCTAGCLDEPDGLDHCNKCPRLSAVIEEFTRSHRPSGAQEHPARNHRGRYYRCTRARSQLSPPKHGEPCGRRILHGRTHSHDNRYHTYVRP